MNEEIDDIPNSGALEEDLKQALRLRHMLFLRKMDQEFVASGERIYYAIDSNVLNAYFSSSPKKRTEFDMSSSGTQQPSMRVFSGPYEEDEDDTALEHVFGKILIRYVLDRIGAQNVPHLLLPGHDAEARALYDRIVGEFDTMPQKAREAKNKIKDFFRQLGSATSDANRFQIAEEWRDALSDILLSLDEPHERFLEFNRLLSEQRFLRIDLASRLDVFSDLRRDDGRHILRTFNSGFGDRVEGSANWWQSELNRYISRDFLKQDKRALTALDRINRLLRPHKAKLVLITSNPAIIRIGMQYYPYRYSSDRASDYSFTDLYIRHPSYLMADTSVMRVDDSQAAKDVGVKPTDWLDTFLTEVTSDLDPDPRAYRETILAYNTSGDDFRISDFTQRSLERDPEIHDRFHGRWRDYLNLVNLSHTTGSDVAIDAIVGQLGKANVEEKALLEQLDEHIRQRTEESWKAFFLSAAKSGLHLVDISARRTGPKRRNVPPMTLRGMGEAREFLRWTAEYDGLVRNKHDIESYLETLESGAADTEATGYLRTLCYAILFAHADRWSVTALVALRAAKIARTLAKSGTDYSSGSEFGPVTGREAYYLAAVALRLTARKSTDLDNSRTQLGKAEEAWEFEKANVTHVEPSHDEPALTGLRFKAERLAIDVTGLLFSTFSTKSPPRSPTKTAELMSQCRKFICDIKAVLDESTDCTDETVRRTVEISLRANLFNLLVILEVTGKGLDASDIKGVEDLVKKQVEDLKFVYPYYTDGVRLSVLDTYLLAYAASIVGPMDEYLASLRRRLRSVSKIDRDRDRLLTMPYDKRRYKSILDLIDRHDQARAEQKADAIEK